METKNYRNIIVRMPNWLGDIVMATPFLQAIKKHFTHAHLTVMCQYPGSMLLTDDPNIDELFAFKRTKPLFFRRDEDASITEKLKIAQYDLGFLLTNSFSSAWWFFQGGVKERVGYRNFPRDFLLTKKMKKPSKQTAIHQVDEYLQLLSLVGIPYEKTSPKLYLKEHEKEQAKMLLKLYGVETKRKLIGVSAGAAYGSAKCWPKEYFIELIEKFSQNETPPFFIFFGDKTQENFIEEICSKFPRMTLNFAGKTNIRELMACINQMDLFLTNDSGPMHIAQALDKKVLALFGSTDKERTGPYHHGKVLYNKVACSPCFKRECPIDFRCMRKITPLLVYEEIVNMIGVE